MTKSLILLVFILSSFPVASAAEGLRFYGDIQLSRGIDAFVRDRGEEPVRRSLGPFLATDDVHIANLEGAAGDGAHCVKGHNPCFPVGKKMFDLLAGFDLVSLENNHSMDLGRQGLADSIREIEERHMIPLGGKRWSVVVETENGNIAIIAVTDVVNSAGDRDSLAMAGSAQVLREIRRLRKISTMVAVYVHWGRELDSLPTKRMKALAREYIRAGADLVAGCHPHVVGKVECLSGQPVVYSLGNFLFDQKYADTKKGAVLDCDINGDEKLVCRLKGHRTRSEWYLPEAEGGITYNAENAVLAVCTPVVRKTWAGKFTKDGREKRLVLKRVRNNKELSFMELYDEATGALEKTTPPMPILKLQTPDLDSDGIREVALEQNIYSSFDGEVAKRIHIYSFNGGFHALWRGSALSRPLLDSLFFAGKDGRPVLLALHSTDSILVRNREKQGCMLMTYRWNGFGFTGVRQRKMDIDADGISLFHGRIRLLNKGKVVRELDAANDPV